jgi:hypothetical protein
MNTLTTWATSLALALFIAAAGGLMDGPNELEAEQATQSSSKDAIDSVAIDARRERAEDRIDQLLAKAHQ